MSLQFLWRCREASPWYHIWLQPSPSNDKWHLVTPIMKYLESHRAALVWFRCVCSLWYLQICHWQSNSINRVWQRMWVWIISFQDFLNLITFKRGSLHSPWSYQHNWWVFQTGASPWGHRSLLCLPSALDRKEIFALGILVQLFTNSFAHTSSWTQGSECGTTNVRDFFLVPVEFSTIPGHLRQ